MPTHRRTRICTHTCTRTYTRRFPRIGTLKPSICQFETLDFSNSTNRNCSELIPEQTPSVLIYRRLLPDSFSAELCLTLFNSVSIQRARGDVGLKPSAAARPHRQVCYLKICYLIGNGAKSIGELGSDITETRCVTCNGCDSVACSAAAFNWRWSTRI